MDELSVEVPQESVHHAWCVLTHCACPQNFGARDATRAEIESNFSENVQGNWDTAHVIK